MKVLDIINESDFDPRNLSHDQIMETLREAFRRNPSAMQNAWTPEQDTKLGWFAQRRANAAEVEGILNTKWGVTLTRLLKVAGIAGPIYMWYKKMQALNELAKEKDENGQYKYTDQYIIGARNGITGVCIISILAVPLMKGAVNGVLGTLFKEILQTLARNLGGKAGGAAIVISTIAATAGWALFAMWLNTKDGEEWLRSFIPELIINGIGWAGNWGIDAFTGWIKDKTGADISPDPDTKQRIDDIPSVSMPFDIDKERAKMRAGARVNGPEIKTGFDYNHNGQNY